jgi:hypothetical protein
MAMEGTFQNAHRHARKRVGETAWFLLSDDEQAKAVAAARDVLDVEHLAKRSDFHRGSDFVARNQ